MATNHFEKKRREHERILKGLERRYDKEGQHLRQYTEDCLSIELLVKENVIDRAHGDLLRERAHHKYCAVEFGKSEEKRLLVQDKRIAARVTKIATILILVVVVFMLLLVRSCGSN
jgi:hypothetical protein